MKANRFIPFVLPAILILTISGYLFTANYTARVYDREGMSYVPLYNAQVVWEFEGEPPLIQYTDIYGKCSTDTNSNEKDSGI